MKNIYYCLLHPKNFLIAIFLSCFNFLGAQLVSVNGQGDLVYQTYANRDQTNAVNTVPDFSRAGYSGGGVTIPDVPVKVTVNPVNGDDGATIQAAIDQVSAMPLDGNGFRGAVLLKAGTYQVEGVLEITSSGVVLRGEGQGNTGGTKILATGQTKRTLIAASSSGSIVETAGTGKLITDTYVPVGSKTITVANTNGLSAGTDIIVQRTPNQLWLDDMQLMGQWGWTPQEYIANYERRITAINGNMLTLDAPIVQAIEDQYGGGRIYKFTWNGRIEKVGVENLRLESEFDNDTDETHAWNGVALKGVKNAWVRKVTTQFFGYSCVNVVPVSINEPSHSRFVTVEDCAMLDPKSPITGGNRYSFLINSLGGQYVLFQRLYTRSGRHDYVTQRLVSGPNVFLDCVGTDTNAEIGPHQKYATGLMFDNVRGGKFEVRNRAGSGSGHGWAGAQTMYWNCQSTGANGNNGSSFNISSPTGARNWGVGNIIGGNQLGNGLWQSVDTPVLPRSLYLAQLEERLGIGAVNNITTVEQRNGNIWTQLLAWAGEGDPSGGTPPGNVSRYEAETIPATGLGATVSDFNDAAASGGALNKLNADGIGDYVEYDINLTAPGTYTIKVGMKTLGSRGIFQLNLPQANQGAGADVGGPQDQYTASSSLIEREIGSFTFGSAGVKNFRFIVTGKNANSSGFSLVFDYIELVPTTLPPPSLTRFEAETIASIGSGATVVDFNDANASGGSLNKLNADGIGDYVEYDIDLPDAGTYDIKVGMKTLNSRGIFQLNLPQANQGNGEDIGNPQDQYTPSSNLEEREIGTFTFASAGIKKFRFAVTGKNVNSSGFSLVFDYIELVDNAAVPLRVNLNNVVVPKITSISLFPNPTSDWLNLELDTENTQELTLKVLDLSGRILLIQKTRVSEGTNLLKMDVNSLPSGTYVISSDGLEKGFSKLFVKRN